MILVVGATGTLGFEVCRLLAERQQSFRALVRVNSNTDKVAQLESIGAKTVLGDLKDPASLAHACQGVAQVISTASATMTRQEGDSIETVDGQGQRNLVAAARAAGVQKFVFISFRENPDIDFPLNQAKRGVEQALRASGMNWTSLQASWFMEGWLSPALGFDYPNASARVYGAGENKISWVSFKDVAQFAVQALDNPAANNTVLGIGGPAQLSPNEVIQIFEGVQGKAFAVERVPVGVLEEQLATAPDTLQESFAGLMLQYAHGDPIDMAGTLEKIPVTLTSVQDYARQVTGR